MASAHDRELESRRRDREANHRSAATGPQPAESDLAYLQRTAGNAAVARLLKDAAPSRPLGPSTRSRLEQGSGVDLSGVRLWLDGSAAARADAVAFTVGRNVVMDPAYYRPNTVAGEALLAHELAHVVQQGEDGGTRASSSALEQDADQAAVAAVTNQGAAGSFPRLRSGLSLQRCKSCTDQELTLAQRLQGETDPARLESALRDATEDQLDRAEQAVQAGSVQADAIAWERAMRRRDFSRIAELNTRTDARFRAAYAPRILEKIMAGGASIRVEIVDPDFEAFVRSSLDQLLRIESGFRLVVELLATGRQVVLRPAAAGVSHTTEPADREASRMQTLPDGRVVPGAGTGSTISLNPSLASNQATLGREGGRTTIIEQDPTASFGHELIHALHNARGESLSPLVAPEILRGVGGGVGLVRDPVTGEPQNPEELRTITGQTSFKRVRSARGDVPDAPESYPLSAGITEDDLRRDLGLPTRTSHFGATETLMVPRRGARNVDDLVARYSVNGAAVPAAGAAAIRSLLVQRGLDRFLTVADQNAQVPLPHPEYVLMYVRFVNGDRRLADALEGLTAR